MIGITENSYANNNIALEWLQYFIDYIQNIKKMYNFFLL